MADTGNDLETRRRRVLYRAGHRGTKEMDWLLGRYAQAAVADMDATALETFEAFLALPDPEIEHWLLAPGAPGPGGPAGEIVAQLKRFHDL